MYNQVSRTRLPTTRQIVTESGESKLNSSTDSSTCFELNPTGASVNRISELHFGEMPVSFRTLLKRFATTDNRTLESSQPSSGVGIKYTAKIIPSLLPSYDDDASVPNLLGYLRYAYTAMRGGFRKRIKLLGPNIMETAHAKVSLLPPNGFTEPYVLDWFIQPNGSFSYLDGTTTFVPMTNSGFEVEIPFYTNNLFVWSCSSNPTDGTDTTLDTLMTHNYLFEYDYRGENDYFQVCEETATAEDFSLIRFVGSPPFMTDL
jgi:hypothetical protein